MQDTSTLPHGVNRRPGSSRGPLLTFNYLPVEFTEGCFDAGTFPYESSEQLADLRKELSEDHMVIRDGDRIVCVPVHDNVDLVGERATFEIRAKRLGLATSLLQDALIRILTRGWHFQLRSFAPPTFVSRLDDRDLMEKAAVRRGGIAGLHVYPEYALDVRRTGPTGKPGIIVKLKTRHEINLPVSDLVRLGVPVVGRYVLMEDPDTKDLPYKDPIARRQLAGLIEAVTGDELQLRNATETIRVSACGAWLDPSPENFTDVLEVVAGSTFAQIASRLDQEKFKLVGAQGRMERTADVATGLIRHSPVTLAKGIQATIGRPVGETGTTGQVKHVPLRHPTYVFDFGGEKTKPYPDDGLNEFGPFDSEAFSPKIPHIVVVTPRKFRGTVEGFVTSFRDGVKGSKVYSQGFIRKYRLTDCTLTFVTFDGDTCDATAYKQACLDAVANNDRVDLAIVISSRDQEHLTGNASPYLVSKSVFMSHGVPVQEFQIETIRRADLAHPLNTVALACYAKLGGIPYVISVPRRTMAHELVIGIGSAHVIHNRMATAQRFVGIATVFNWDGNYLVSNLSKEAPYENYPQELLRALRTCIEDVKNRNAWQPQDTIRLVFHVFKPLKDRETSAVMNLVEDLTKDFAGVEFAFLHVSDKHNWMMLDRASAGLTYGQEVKGKYVPTRGHAVRISGSEMLISVCGPRDIKMPSHGAPRPLLLKLHRESTFTDLDYLAGQVFRFTALSWRRLYPSRQPVTILYSHLIAELLGKLREVSNWNSDMLATSKLRWSRWFL